jgi:hypothetical protein
MGTWRDGQEVGERRGRLQGRMDDLVSLISGRHRNPPIVLMRVFSHGYRISL